MLWDSSNDERGHSSGGGSGGCADSGGGAVGGSGEDGAAKRGSRVGVSVDGGAGGLDEGLGNFDEMGSM